MNYAKWVIGEDVDSAQEYLFHLEEPMFVCKFVDAGENAPLSTFSYSTECGETLFDFLWFTPSPIGKDLEKLLAEAGEAITRDSQKEYEVEEEEDA